MLIIFVEVEGIFNLRFLIYDDDNLLEEVFILFYLIYGRRIYLLLEVLELEEEFGENSVIYIRRYKYLIKKL